MNKTIWALVFFFMISTGFLIYMTATQAYLQGKVDAYHENEKFEKDYNKFDRDLGICKDSELAVFEARERAGC
jgi:hypothetical protein